MYTHTHTHNLTSFFDNCIGITPGGTSSKDRPASAGDIKHVGLISGLGRSLGRGHGNPLQYSCLENPMENKAWWATVHSVTKSQMQLK